MTNKTNKKGIKRQFKYEIIVFMILSLLDNYCIISHIIRNGFELDKLCYEIVIYYSFTFMFYFISKDIRKNPKEYSIKELCK